MNEHVERMEYHITSMEHHIEALEAERAQDRAAIAYLNKTLRVYHDYAGCGSTYPKGPVPECMGCSAAHLYAAAIARAEGSRERDRDD